MRSALFLGFPGLKQFVHENQKLRSINERLKGIRPARPPWTVNVAANSTARARRCG